MRKGGEICSAGANVYLRGGRIGGRFTPLAANLSVTTTAWRQSKRHVNSVSTPAQNLWETCQKVKEKNDHN